MLRREVLHEFENLGSELAAREAVAGGCRGIGDCAAVFDILVIGEFGPLLPANAVDAVVDRDAVYPGAVIAVAVEGIERAVGFYEDFLDEVECIFVVGAVPAGYVIDAIVVGVKKLFKEPVSGRYLFPSGLGGTRVLSAYSCPG